MGLGKEKVSKKQQERNARNKERLKKRKKKIIQNKTKAKQRTKKKRTKARNKKETTKERKKNTPNKHAWAHDLHSFDVFYRFKLYAHPAICTRYTNI